MNTTNLAEAKGTHLGGVSGIGVEVHADSDSVRAVVAGFKAIGSIGSLRQNGITGANWAPS